MRALQRLRAALLALAACALAAGASAEIYTCRDATGNAHFADALHKLPETCRERGHVADLDQTNPNLKQPGRKTSGAPEGSSVDGADGDEDDDLARKKKLGLVDKDGHDESWWRERKRGLEERKKEIEGKLQGLESMGPIDPYGFYGRKSFYLLEEKKKLLKADLEKVEAEIAELTAEARKAGAQPGWLR